MVKFTLMLVFCVAEKLPFSIKILLESAIRNCDEFQVKSNDVEKIIDWENTSPKQVEIPFKPARVLLQVNQCVDCQSLNLKLSQFSVTWIINVLFIWFSGLYWSTSCR